MSLEKLKEKKLKGRERESRNMNGRESGVRSPTMLLNVHTKYLEFARLT